MKVVGLQAENFGILKLVNIEIPKDKNYVEITGKNAQGKSTVLDIVWHILQNKAQKIKGGEQLRKGADKGYTRMITDKYIFERVFKNNETSSLKIIDKQTNGIATSSPQTVINNWLKDYTLDIGEFMTKDHKELSEMLLKITGLDVSITKIDNKISELENERLITGRQRKALGHIEPVKKAEKIDVSKILAEYTIAQQQLRLNDDLKTAVKTAQMKIESIKKQLEIAEEELRLAEADYKNKYDDSKDVDELKQKLESAQSINEQAQNYQAYVTTKQKADDLDSKYDALSKQINDLRNEKQKMLENADYPVEGLSYSAESGLLYNGQSRLSDSERIEVGFGIIAAKNPDIRIVLIKHGGDLDLDSRQHIKHMAEEHDFLVLFETVFASENEVGFIIENGEVKE